MRFNNWLKDRIVQALIVGIATASIYTTITELLNMNQRAMRILVSSMFTLICFYFIFESIRNVIINVIVVIKIYYKILLFICLPVIILLIIYPPYTTIIPCNITKARLAVIEIQQSLYDKGVKQWLAAEELYAPPIKKLIVKNYELIVEENLQNHNMVFKTYIRDGKKIAEDIQLAGPYPFARKYYRYNDGYHIGTDYYKRSGEHVLLQYEDIFGQDKKIDVKSPIFLPPIPIFIYR